MLIVPYGKIDYMYSLGYIPHVSKSITDHFYFHDNFGKSVSIFIIFFTINSERISGEDGIKTTT